MQEELLQGKDAIAKAVGVSWPTVRKLIQEDNLPARRLGKFWFASPSAINEWKADRFRYKGGEANV